MTDVIDLAAFRHARALLDEATVPEEDRRVLDLYALQGEAKCLACGHAWWASANPGDIDLECPQCKTFRGVFKYPVEPGPEEHMFHCQCGCSLFTLAPSSGLLLAVCLSCGQHHDPSAISRVERQGLS